jgi:hypothetical protein
MDTAASILKGIISVGPAAKAPHENYRKHHVRMDAVLFNGELIQGMLHKMQTRWDPDAVSEGHMWLVALEYES